jgi:tetratricopeptide (TPR) repeat protein
MARRIIAILLALSFASVVHASEESTALLKKAKAARAAEQHQAVERYLAAAIKQDPSDLEARWFLINLGLGELVNVDLPARAERLAEIAPAFNALVDMAKKARRTAFAHYITAVYATYYKNYDRAVAEIDKALALEPKSTRFIGAKGNVLRHYGQWSGTDKRLESAIQYLKQAAEQASKEIEPDSEPNSYNLEIAEAYSDFRRPRWQEATHYYERYLQQSKYHSTGYAIAWNNVSIAYRKLGECQKAKQAAETALKVTPFGAAVMNLNRAEFCLEMRRLGMATHFTEEAEPEFSH